LAVWVTSCPIATFPLLLPLKLQELDDEGFDFSVLSEFRAGLVVGGREALLLEALRARLGELGLAGPGMRQRTDSTHGLGRIRDLNRSALPGP
jgi:hypothetical protein